MFLNIDVLLYPLSILFVFTFAVKVSMSNQCFEIFLVNMELETNIWNIANANH